MREAAFWIVSVLFSEPKIPQFCRLRIYNKTAERFQCSSASRKFLNVVRFADDARPNGFQCSSASRKFLNQTWDGIMSVVTAGFSALQRAENSSIFRRSRDELRQIVSVLFSEPKIPQFWKSGAWRLWYNKFQCSSASRKFLNALILPVLS